MLSNLTSRPMLAATTSAAAICVGLFVVVPAMQTGKVTAPEVFAPKPVVQTAVPPQPELAIAGEDKADDGAADLDAGRRDARAQTDAPAPTISQLAETDEAEAPIAEATNTGTVERAPMAAAPVAKAAPEAPPEGDLSRLRTERSSDEMADAAGGATMDAIAPAESRAAGAPLSMAPSPQDQEFLQPEPNTEAFANEEPGAIKSVTTEPVSTFSIDVDTASYGLVRSSLMAGYLPPTDAVRIEEMVNYFPYGYAGPELAEAPFRSQVSVIPAPWNADKKLVHIGIQGRLPALEDRPPLNLVFLIDTSGSMQDANKLPLLKQSFRLMLGQLRPEDQVAIVTYAGSAGQVLEATPAKDGTKIMAALDRLEAGGSTAGQEGLQQAYSVAEGMADDGEVTRVILATDGDFNVGIYDPEELKTYIEGKRKSGTYLSVLGFGRGNIDDATMQALAQNGNGQAAYIDTLSEAQKVLVDQLSGALFPIANDVKIQVEFNPATIAEYRLIGYETRALAREDFNNDRVDAGDIGAGHSVTAIYEVTPVGSPAISVDPLRYAAETEAVQATPTDGPQEFGFLKLRYKEPGEASSQLLQTPILEGGEMTGDQAFATAIAGFGQLLTGATYLGDWGWDEAIALANASKGADEFGYRAEAVQMMRLAQSLQR